MLVVMKRSMSIMLKYRFEDYKKWRYTWNSIVSSSCDCTCAKILNELILENDISSFDPFHGSERLFMKLWTIAQFTSGRM